MGFTPYLQGSAADKGVPETCRGPRSSWRKGKGRARTSRSRRSRPAQSFPGPRGAHHPRHEPRTPRSRGGVLHLGRYRPWAPEWCGARDHGELRQCHSCRPHRQARRRRQPSRGGYGPSLPPPIDRRHRAKDMCTTYPQVADEFRLAIVEGGSAEFAAGPRMILSLEGEATLRSSVGELALAKGEAAFVPYSDGSVTVESAGKTAVASVG